MADLPENDDLELDEDLEADEPDDQEQEAPDQEAEFEESDEDDLIIEGEEDSPSSGDRDTGLVRDLRARLKEQSERLKRLEANEPKIELGPKPTLDDVNYDTDAYDAALLKWHEDKAKVDKAKAGQQDQVKRIAEDVEEDRREYQRQQTQLKVPGFELAEAKVMEKLSDAQQIALISSAKNKAAVVAALGKYPKRLDALADIKNPFKLAAAVAELERNLKVQPRRKGPEPEERQRGSAPISQNARAKELDRLMAKAARGGDVTDTLKRIRELRAKG